MARQRLTPEEYKLRRKESVKKWWEKNKDKTKAYSKKWRQDNPDYNTEYFKTYNSSDPLFKLKHDVRHLINDSVRRGKFTKRSKTSDILGCTWDEFKQHIESQFEPWMNWGNYGCKSPSGPDATWDLDHIIPVSSAVNEDDIKRLNHYTNFQPLCSFQNRFIKRDRAM